MQVCLLPAETTLSCHHKGLFDICTLLFALCLHYLQLICKGFLPMHLFSTASNQSSKLSPAAMCLWISPWLLYRSFAFCSIVNHKTSLRSQSLNATWSALKQYSYISSFKKHNLNICIFIDKAIKIMKFVETYLFAKHLYFSCWLHRLMLRPLEWIHFSHFSNQHMPKHIIGLLWATLDVLPNQWNIVLCDYPDICVRNIIFLLCK